MKKITYIILIISTLFAIISCNKNELIKQNELTTDINMSRISQIKQFRKNTKENIKSGTMMNANEALLLIEATFNYTYAWADFKYEDIIIDTILLVTNVNNEQILQSDAIQIYNSILEELQNTFTDIVADQKKFVFIDLYFDENAEVPTIIAEAGFGTKSNVKSAETIDTDDWWYWGHDHGKCGNYSGIEGNIKDACDLIRTEAYNTLRTPMAGYYWENYTWKILKPSEHPAPTGSDWPNLLFSWGHDGNYVWNPEPCLSPDDNTFFINGLIQIIEEGENDNNKQFANFLVLNDNAYYSPLPDGYTHKKHEGSYKLAIKRKKDPIDPVPYDLFTK